MKHRRPCAYKKHLGPETLVCTRSCIPLAGAQRLHSAFELLTPVDTGPIFSASSATGFINVAASFMSAPLRRLHAACQEMASAT